MAEKVDPVVAMEGIPVWACVAFAVRCGRRVLPLVEKYDPPVAGSLRSSLSSAAEMASRGGRAVTSLYQGARKTITQEEAWEETERSVSELTDVVRVQHAMILDLLSRVERLEAAARPPSKPE